MSEGIEQLESPLLLTVVQGAWAAWTVDGEAPHSLEREDVLALAAGSSGTPAHVHTEVSDLPVGTLPAGTGRVWRLGRHLALEPADGAYVAYSSRTRKRFRIPAELAAELVEVEHPEADAPEPTANALVEALEAAGFLVRRDAFPEIESRPNAAVSFARYASRGAARAIKKRDADADLAGRVPVYFASCLDLGNQMGYGFLNLALGALMASIQEWNAGALTERYFLVPDFLLSPVAVTAAAEKYGPGIVFFSNYIWATEKNLVAARAVKELDPRFLTVFGGPNAPAYPKAAEDFFAKHAYVDVLARSEGEITAVDLVDRVKWDGRTPDLSGLPEVEGVMFRSPDGASIVRTPDRPRIKDVNALPSPYLTGVFDAVPPKVLYGATLETNRGCPYGCTFCDWGSATRQKIRKFDLDRIEAELDWMGRSGISLLFCADANFGIFERDVQIAQMIADMSKKYGALKQIITNYAKNNTAHLAEIIKIFARAGLASDGVLSIQTRDPVTLQAIKRNNIKSSRYDELLEVFREEKLPLSTDLMIGLPGATTTSFKHDLQYYFDAGVEAKAYLTRMLTNSPMAEPSYRESFKIQTDEAGFITASSSFTEAELNYMLDLFGLFSLGVGYGVLKYVLRFAQQATGVDAIDIVDAALRDMHADPSRYPHLTWLMGFLDNQRRSPGGWRPVLEEFASFLEREYALPWDSALETVLMVQEAVLADPDKVVGVRLDLPHDFVAWYKAGADRGPLGSYGPGSITVQDPQGLCHADPTRHYQYDTHYVSWELNSELNDVVRPTFFLEREGVSRLAWPHRTTTGRRAW